MLKKIIFPLIVASSTSSFANDVQNQTEVGLLLGLASGGDTMASFEFDDGSSDNIKAGSGFLLGASLKAPITEVNEQQIDLIASFNYMSDSVSASNGDASFSRLPIELLVSTRFDSLSISGGFTYHLSPEFEVDLPGDSGSVEADDALGYVLEANYHLSNGSRSNNLYFGLKYTNIEYDFTGASFDGSGFAITMGTYFN